MKKSVLILAGITLFFCSNLQGQITKEEAAIKAAFEGEKAAFFKQDHVGMGEYWVKEPATMKYWLGPEGSTKIVGWENVDASQKKETEDNRWDRNQMKATFSNYKINIMGNSAWVFCETDWDGINNGKKFNLKQERIVVLKKVDDKWKFSLYGIFQLPNSETTNQ
ncbi:MAG: nuclear transport factor 2 family protein [Candidatus Methanofastidiosa archaeon]|nr:nuclear transport factor 2 family protein [Candidatus Methanofastidiosa archaeon]